MGQRRFPGAARRRGRPKRRRRRHQRRPRARRRRGRSRLTTMPEAREHASTSAGERGVALLMVLWIFMVLTVLVAEFSRGMRDDAIATQNLAEEAQARGVAIAGM